MPDQEKPDKETEERDGWKRPVWDHLVLFGVTVPPWLFWTTIGIILGTITLETLEHWDAYAAEPFLRQLWLAASADKFQTPLALAANYVPVGLGLHQIKEAINMRFFNREATLEKVREYGRSQGRAERDRAWAGWVQRRDAAAERNEPFNEPPPSETRD